jgi:hypothetical protein
MTIPSVIRVGDSLAFKEENVRGISPINGEVIIFTPPDWTLYYRLVGVTQLTIAATNSNGVYLVSISSAQTSTLAKGYLTYSKYVVNGANRVTIETGTIQATDDLSIAIAPIDSRTEAAKQLEKINEVILARLANGAPVRYMIKAREMWYTPLSELYAIRNALRAEVAKQKGKGDQYSLIRFTGA